MKKIKKNLNIIFAQIKNLLKFIVKNKWQCKLFFDLRPFSQKKYYEILSGCLHSSSLFISTDFILRWMTGHFFSSAWNQVVPDIDSGWFEKTNDVIHSNNQLKKGFHFIFLVRSWKGIGNFDVCIDSIFNQKKTNYTIIYIDDYSLLKPKKKKIIRKKLQKHFVVFNSVRKFAVRNAYEALHSYGKKIADRNAKKHCIVISLDGDDWLYDNNVLEKLERIYIKEKSICTYGNCKIFDPRISNKLFLANKSEKHANYRFPKLVEVKREFRSFLPFYPLHLKSWRLDVFLNIPKYFFLRPDKKWIRFCEDQAIFYPLLEIAGDRYTALSQPLSVYNRSHSFHDDQIHLKEMLFDELVIRKK